MNFMHIVTLLRLVGKQMGSSDQLRGATLCEVPGKGLGLVATRGELSTRAGGNFKIPLQSFLLAAW